MIKIILKNFRKFEKNEFLFDKHLTLISGKSGKGKTTIFMAIVFALTGEGKKIVTYGKTSCSVKLEIKMGDSKKLIITRTKRPNRVVVEVDSNKNLYEDKEAQVIIDDLFHQYQLGYMSQRVDNKSFILMSPMDKMRFIQKIAFGNENVDVLNKHCRELIKERKDDMMLTSRQRETTQKMLEELKIKKNKKDIDIDDDEDKLQEKIITLEKEIHLKTRLFDKTLSIIKLKNDLKKQLDDIPIVDENIFDIENQIKNIHLQDQKWENYQREKKKLDKIEQAAVKGPVIKKEDIKVMISDMKQFIELETQVKEVNDLKKKLEVVIKQIQEMSIPMICPECNNEIELLCDDSGVGVLKKITKKNKINPISLKSLLSYDKAKKVEEQKYKLQTKIEELENKKIDLEILKAEYPNVKDPKNQLDLLFKILRENDEREKQQNICNSFGNMSNYNSVQNKVTLNNLKHKQKLKYSRSEKETSYKSLKVDQNLDLLEDEIKKISTELEDTKELVKKLQSKKYWTKVETLSKHEEQLNKSYPRAVKLQNIIKYAEKLAIEETIEQINLHSQLYLDYFLDNISVSLAFDKDGTKLNMNVIQDNFESDLNNLSGGELARVILAFTIALAELNNVKLLLLDECVSSLDQETTTNVIETVRNNFNGTVICIAHQTTTGIFDHVLEL